MVESLEKKLKGDVDSGKGSVTVVDDARSRFHRELFSVQERFEQMLRARFEERAAALKAGETLLAPFRSRLTAAIERAADLCKESANSVFTSALRRSSEHMLERKFMDVTSECIRLSKRIGEEEARSIFLQEWQKHLKEVIRKHEEGLPPLDSICAGLCLLHQTILVQERFSRGISPIDPETVKRHVESREASMLEKYSAEGFADDFLTRPFEVAQRVPMMLFGGAGVNWRKEAIKAHQLFVTELKRILESCNVLAHSDAASSEAVTKSTLTQAYQRARSLVQTDFPGLLQRHIRGYRYASGAEQRLLGFLPFSIVESCELAKTYAKKLKDKVAEEVLDSNINAIALRIATRVQQDMPDPRSSCKRAFQETFEKGDLPEAVKFVLAPHLYLSEMFDKSWTFLQEKEEATQLPVL
uniref:Uncharacterized protein n=1 Tax=Chromera velia CCMP2878 TaxID=1169474 RepID=A0A0G4G631_9ALVE|eukprot:Cvel_4198.t1-p1 / transcript=Cvel_4198.t1 / gene=Cvel_4198 / organism=Chromera_velia_CCMP2878 / gene_product=hypothetical protein / transcript_product=hypothetical protein / location=Cvel_scaffold181:45790-47321(-) / protein_length=413 / sequence_SO=supercontig / SO=protein_coding / is_pseudo=false